MAIYKFKQDSIEPDSLKRSLKRIKQGSIKVISDMVIVTLEDDFTIDEIEFPLEDVDKLFKKVITRGCVTKEDDEW